MQKQIIFKTKGMQRDSSVSAFNSEFAYEIKNMRVIATTDNTSFSLVNEKGTKEINITNEDSTNSLLILQGTPIGSSTIDNNLVIFTTENNSADNLNPDHIYRITLDKTKNTFSGKQIYNGNLGFSVGYPIETLSFFENNLIQKVYWVDGKNSPRVINIMEDYSTSTDSSTLFDFTPTLKLDEEVSIVRNENGGGNFASGVIQYTFSYYDSYGRESNLFYTSPLYYISHHDRGGSPEESVSCSFTITINNIDTSFDYLRIYSIQRTSIDSTPTVKRVTDISIKGTDTTTVSYTDNGLNGDTVDSTSLLYIGGEDIIAGTLSQKDNVLFLGDFQIKREIITQDIIDSLRTGINITFSADKELTLPEPIGSYPYNNQLSNNSNQIKTFKYLEYYRFGIQFQHYTGKWSEPIWLGDKQNLTKIKTSADGEGDISSSKIYLVEAVCNIANGLNAIKDLGYVRARPVVVYPTINDRSCICQGVLCPTVYNIQDRYSNSPFAQSSWFARPNAPFEVSTAVAPDRTFVGFKFNCYFKLDETKEFANTYSGSDGNNIYTYVSHTTTTVVENEVQVTYINSITMSPSRPDRSPAMSGYLMSSEIFSEDADSYYNLIQYTSYTKEYSDNSTLPSEWRDLDDIDVNLSVNSPYGLVYQNNILNDSTLINETRYGYWAEFRHDWPIPDNSFKNAEIQCIWGNPDSPVINSAEYSTEGWVHDNAENYFIDQSIITLHSPEIEFDTEVRNLDTSNLKLRITGVVPITSSMTDIDIQTSSASLFFKNSQIESPGFYKENVGSDNLSRAGYRGIISGVFWMDEVYNRNSSNSNQSNVGFVVYPWHRSGSLNNQKFADSSGNRSSMLEQKKMSNLRYSYKTIYLDYDNLWMAYDEYSQAAHPGVSDIQVFDSNEVTLLKLNGPNDTSINYYGNVDKVLTYSRVDYDYLGWNKQNGYPIIVSNVTSPDIHDTYLGNYSVLREWNITDQAAGVDPIRIKYKSTPHAVITLNAYKNQDGQSSQLILPTIYERGNVINYCNTTNGWNLNQEGYKYFWEQNKNTYGIIQSVIELGINGETNLMQSTTSSTLGYGWLWLGELYRDEVINRFGGTSEEAFENNSWLPCGKAVDLEGNSITLRWNEGDTYYQRYDHIKTYPFTLEDPNSITEIVSFMCETRMNLDGRYDRNRGQSNNLVVTPENFNLLNTAYNQSNNYFNYRGTNLNRVQLNEYNNSIIYSMTKTLGESIDAWTNLTLANVLDLDGDRGKVTAIRKFNNQLIAFQEKAISQILFNESMQLSTTEGVPVEIANSGRVNGKRYLTEDIGCWNKWSICETSNGLYFIDDITKGIFLYNGKLNNLSDSFGMRSWINTHSDTNNIWNPINLDNCVTYKDKTNGDILFITKDYCLVYSEPLGMFSSFLSYDSVPYIESIGDKTIAINISRGTENADNTYKVWELEAGEYNYFFDKYEPFSVTVIANPDPQTDKIFNTLEFRADSWNGQNNIFLTSPPFDNIHTWNEYQESQAKLVNILDKPSILKRKFRIWRANIPRDAANNRDRMRNPWLYIKLSMEEENTNKTILHDMIVHYFE